MKTVHGKVEVLSESEIEQIHRATLDVLSTVGCHLPHRRVLERLQKEGAAVDHAKGRATLPPALVERAVKALTSGRRITSEEKFQRGVLHDGPLRISACGEANIVDYGATRRRQGTTEDVLRGLVLCNELPYVGSAMPLVTPADVPGHMSDLYSYYLCALYSRKPYGVYMMSPEAARQIMRIARIRAGGAKVRLGYLLEPNGTLSYDDFSLELALLFAESGHTFHIGPMAMAGLDAPVTIAGTLLMQNAYNLIGNVIAYLWGVPGGWCAAAHTVDLRSTMCLFGSPNQVLIGWAGLQVANWYGFESGANCALTDACVPDFQGGFEKGMSALAMLLAGGGFGGQGIVGADQGTSFEQLVIDNEWASALDHIFSHGVEVNAETLGVAAIKRAGILGSHLEDEHTLRHMRQTQWPTTLFNYERWDTWMAKGGKEVYARAHERVQEILARHYPPQMLVGASAKAEMDAIIAEAKACPERFEMRRYGYGTD